MRLQCPFISHMTIKMEPTPQPFILNGCEPLLQLEVSREGRSEYRHKSGSPSSSASLSAQCDAGVLYIQSVSNTDVGIFTDDTVTPPLTKILCIRDAFYFIPIGTKRGFICHGCGKISKKMKVFESCPEFNFCCITCLDQQKPFLLACGPIISSLMKVAGKFVDIQLLSLMVCYHDFRHWQDHGYHSPNFSKLLKLKQHNFVQLDGLLEAVNQLVATTGSLMDVGGCSGTFGPSMVQSVMRIVMFNSYQVPMITIPGTFILVLHPILARINHSCAPNCMLAAGMDTSGSLAFTIVSVREVPASQEITISYLSDLASLAESRRELLSSSFHFTCCCSRCQVVPCYPAADLTAQEPVENSSSFDVIAGDLATHLILQQSLLGGKPPTDTNIRVEAPIQWWLRQLRGSSVRPSSSSTSSLATVNLIDALINSQKLHLFQEVALIRPRHEIQTDSVTELTKNLLCCLQDSVETSNLLMMEYRNWCGGTAVEQPEGDIANLHTIVVNNMQFGKDALSLICVGILSWYWEHNIGCFCLYGHVNVLLRSVTIGRSICNHLTATNGSSASESLRNPFTRKVLSLCSRLLTKLSDILVVFLSPLEIPQAADAITITAAVVTPSPGLGSLELDRLQVIWSQTKSLIIEMQSLL
jgi:hypothetical protein